MFIIVKFAMYNYFLTIKKLIQMKKIISLCAMLVMVLTVTCSLNSCSNAKVGAVIGTIASQCPIDMGNGIQITSADIDDNGDAVLTVTCPEDYNVELLKSNETVMKQSSIQSVKQDAEFAKTLKDAGMKLIYRYKFTDNSHYDIVVNPDEL